jgi:hypothetical protein
MDFSNYLNQQLNSMFGGNQNMEGGGLLVWVVLVLVIVGAVGVYLYLNEYFGCNSGRLLVDGKCVNLCPEGYTFKKTDLEAKVAVCTKGDKDTNYALPTPKPAAADASSTPAPTTTPATTTVTGTATTPVKTQG